MRIVGIEHEEKGLPCCPRLPQERGRKVAIAVRTASVPQIVHIPFHIPLKIGVGRGMADLAQDAQAVAAGAEDLRQNGNSGPAQGEEALAPAAVRVAAGHEGRSTGLADGNCDVSMVETHARGSELIDMGRGPPPPDTHRPPPHPSSCRPP